MARNIFSDAAWGRHCGRIHLGPICINGGAAGQAICERCKRDVTREDRIICQRMWDQVRDIKREVGVSC
jgi:hypothetical protein